MYSQVQTTTKKTLSLCDVRCLFFEDFSLKLLSRKCHDTISDSGWEPESNGYTKENKGNKIMTIIIIQHLKLSKN